MRLTPIALALLVAGCSSGSGYNTPAASDLVLAASALKAPAKTVKPNTLVAIQWKAGSPSIRSYCVAPQYQDGPC